MFSGNDLVAYMRSVPVQLGEREQGARPILGLLIRLEQERLAYRQHNVDFITVVSIS